MGFNILLLFLLFYLQDKILIQNLFYFSGIHCRVTCRNCLSLVCHSNYFYVKCAFWLSLAIFPITRSTWFSSLKVCIKNLIFFFHNFVIYNFTWYESYSLKCESNSVNINWLTFFRGFAILFFRAFACVKSFESVKDTIPRFRNILINKCNKLCNLFCTPLINLVIILDYFILLVTWNIVWKLKF